ncbi:sulfotransferase family protein [Nitrincola tapanii]|uniref:Sulfotransferase family protein n=1 Tax=Nitrincola tapanii TaxID=1708751 RepID=A0A5A9W1E5_9GAMM|nr:sulfotransferase family protein [Nitrincola tapanii]KAA0874392.1 sulfotransferase family protein [Nitrincola tapanii]
MSSIEPEEKIFCIGFHKTGTKSLAAALTELGYRVHGPAWTQDQQVCRSLDQLQERAFSVIEAYDAFQDNPWPLLWESLRASYPKARFILTWREADRWLSSAVRYFGHQKTPMRALIYGEDAASPIGYEQRYLQRYSAHNNAVRAAFKGAENFLELNFEQEAGWKALCDFLHKPLPKMPFPHKNKGD